MKTASSALGFAKRRFSNRRQSQAVGRCAVNPLLVTE